MLEQPLHSVHGLSDDSQWQQALRLGSVQQQHGIRTASKGAAAWYGLAARRLLTTASLEAGAVAAKGSSGAATAARQVRRITNHGCNLQLLRAPQLAKSVQDLPISMRTFISACSSAASKW